MLSGEYASRLTQTVPYGTVRFLNAFQAVNCLAIIISSLRDKNRPELDWFSGVCPSAIGRPLPTGGGRHANRDLTQVRSRRKHPASRLV